jgi:hypothetical protein
MQYYRQSDIILILTNCYRCLPSFPLPQHRNLSFSSSPSARNEQLDCEDRPQEGENNKGTKTLVLSFLPRNSSPDTSHFDSLSVKTVKSEINCKHCMVVIH